MIRPSHNGLVMVHTHRNPLHQSIHSRSAQQWQKSLSCATAENVLQVCQDCEIWKGLTPFKSFLFARHIFSIKRLNSDSIDAFISNVPQLQEYISQLSEECISLKDIYYIFDYLFGHNNFTSAAVVFNSCSEPVQRWIINKMLHIRQIYLFSHERDAIFFTNLKNHLPRVWSELIFRSFVKLTNFNMLQRHPEVLTSGEYHEDNEVFLDHIASGNHRIYIHTTPNLFLTFLVDNSMLDNPQLFNKQLRQIQIWIWLNLLAHFHTLELIDVGFFCGVLEETFKYIDVSHHQGLSVLNDEVSRIRLKNILIDETFKNDCNDLQRKI